ncbi:MAG: COX15/CtaA family protein [Gemmatimonadetes bacterium]|nr:COX15/CtaA family protein [Gemmatimonadota bacterium]
MKNIRYRAITATVLVYALVVLGGVVRITGSGMGCGDDWPLCNGRLFPPLDDLATVIEYGHRQLAALITVLIAATALMTFRHRSTPGVKVRGGGGLGRPAALVVVLLVVQILLGAVTVWLELPAWSVVLHLSAALALLATLVVLTLRAGTTPNPTPQGTSRGLAHGTVALTGLTALTLLLGALTANLDAGGACLGFPLCSGQIWPSGGIAGLARVHWIHRLLAYGLFLLTLVLAARARGAPAPVRRTLWACLGLVTAQLGVAVVMIMLGLPQIWRVLHVAVGTALWVAVVYAVWLTGGRANLRQTIDSRQGPGALWGT